MARPHTVEEAIGDIIEYERGREDATRPPESWPTGSALAALRLAAALTILTTPMAIRDRRAAPASSTTRSATRPTGRQPPISVGRGAHRRRAGDSRVRRARPAAIGPCSLGAIGLWLVGTIDDRLNLSPLLRVAIEALVALLLWRRRPRLGDPGQRSRRTCPDRVLGDRIVNAFNLMDNLDGAAASVGAVSAAGVGTLAVDRRRRAPGGDRVSRSAARCAGFLPYNLARPSRIFLGDGGSMPIGFLLAASLMVVPMEDLTGWSALAAATLAVGLPVFDTALVVVSRRRRGAQVFSGATDHTTHRLLGVLRAPRAVALALAAGQAGLCGLAIEATRLGPEAALVIGSIVLLLGAATIIAVEWPTRWTPVSDDA